MMFPCFLLKVWRVPRVPWLSVTVPPDLCFNVAIIFLECIKSNEHCMSYTTLLESVTIYSISDMFGVPRLGCHGLVFYNEVIVRCTDNAASWSQECFSLGVILLYH